MAPSAAPAEAPLVLVEKVRGALRLHATDRGATALGIVPGMMLADARARLPELEAVPANTSADHAFLVGLAEACERFTPVFAPDPPDGLLLDVTGCAHLLGGEAALHAEVLARHERLGLTARGSLAGTPDAARALARYGDTMVVPAGSDAEAARTLPVAALGLEPVTTQALTRAGLRQVGDLADRPSTVLAARFGEELIQRLARILGQEDVRIVPLRPPPACWAARRFAEPLAHMDGVRAVLGLLVSEVAEELAGRAAGGRVFELVLFRGDGTARRVAVETGRPVRDGAVLRRLFRERFEVLGGTLDPGFGFEVIRLSVPVVEGLEIRQLRLGGGGDDETGVAELVDRLAARLGRGRVLRFVARDTHRPERQSAQVPALEADGAEGDSWPGPEPGEPPMRPLHLFDPPQPIEAMAEVPDGPPRRFRWRRGLHEVTLAEGPERIAPEWWRRDAIARGRDYYRVEDREGRRFWIFREGLYGREAEAPCWFLHGLFD
jgi:protein ImuB